MKNDIKNYIESQIPELSGCLYPVFAEVSNSVCIVYKITQTSGGHLKESQLELRIIHDDYDVCMETENKVMAALDMEEDSPFISFGGIRFKSQVAGGGVLFNDAYQKFEDTLYFIINWR